MPSAEDHRNVLEYNRHRFRPPKDGHLPLLILLPIIPTIALARTMGHIVFGSLTHDMGRPKKAGHDGKESKRRQYKLPDPSIHRSIPVQRPAGGVAYANEPLAY